MRAQRKPLALGLSLLVTLAIALTAASCGSTQESVCDPVTIEHNGRCFWEKQPACDFAGCLPPNECELVEGKPAHVVCHKADAPAK
jgi:hypothetical protein